MHAQNGALRRINDGRAHEGAKHAAIGDGEGATRHVFERQFALLSLGGIGPNGLLNVRKGHVLDVAQNWHNQTCACVASTRSMALLFGRKVNLVMHGCSSLA